MPAQSFAGWLAPCTAPDALRLLLPGSATAVLSIPLPPVSVDPAAPASPCIRACRIDGDGLCRGCLRTGDVGTIDADGYVWLEGRKSEVFKTSTGRRIAPAPIEGALKATTPKNPINSETNSTVDGFFLY